MTAKPDYSRSNLVEDEYHDADAVHAPLNGKLTWGVRYRSPDGLLRQSEQEEMFWTALSGVNDNDE